MVRIVSITLLLSAAALVSADLDLPPINEAPTLSYSETYKTELPSYEHHRCDATECNCFPPNSYGPKYNPKSYSYGRKYPYPGPLKRFRKRLRQLKDRIIGFISKIKRKLLCTWDNFKNNWNEWCARKKSDFERFKDWTACKKDKFKKWWAYHQDLLKVRKQLWDDAQREFHRQWMNYKCHAKEDYQKKRKECAITERDYDEVADYRADLNQKGCSPIEQSYRPTLTYDKNAYQNNCKKLDEEYYRENPQEKPHNY